MPEKVAPSLASPSSQSSKELSLFSHVMRNLVRSGESEAACLCVGSHTVSSTMSGLTNSGWSLWRTIGAGQNTGRVGSSLGPNQLLHRTVERHRSAPRLNCRCWAPLSSTERDFLGERRNQ